MGITPWSPAQITTEAWYDAADLSTITQGGGFVSQWSDKSGNANDATQGTGSNQPSTGVATIGGRNAIDFDISGNHRLNTMLTQLTTMTIVGVFSPKNRGNNNNNQPLGASSGFADGGLTWSLQAFNSPYSARQIVLYGTNLTNKSYNGNAGSSPSAFQDGIFAHWGTGVNTQGFNYRIGNRGSSDDPNNAFYGAIGELIIIPSELSDSDRQRVEGYLAWKWGLQANLPVGHPYETIRPTV